MLFIRKLPVFLCVKSNDSKHFYRNLPLSPSIRPPPSRKLVQAFSESYKVKNFLISVLFTLRVAVNVCRGFGSG